MTDSWNTIEDAPVRPQEAFSGVGGDDWYSAARLARMEHLGASVEELAREMMESIIGYEGKGGHKPPRADIQKMKDVYLLQMQNEGHERAQKEETMREMIPPDAQALNAQSAQEWKEKHELTDKEDGYIRAYNVVMREYKSPEHAFNALCAIYAPNGDVTPEVKKTVGTLLKKNEERHYGQLYIAIKNAVADMYRMSNESYKLWPWAVKQMKEQFQRDLSYGHVSEPGRGAFSFKHIVDVVTEGGKILNQLRQENRIPQNFDVNKINFEEFETWLADWKRENLKAESAGQIVYQWDDGYTIQRLMSPEQLQHEGDEMGHCVGGYSQSVQSGDTLIYSLRDKGGVPHVTIEMNGRGIWETAHPDPISKWTAETFEGGAAPSDVLLNGNAFPHLDTDEDYDHYYKLKYDNRDQADQLYPSYGHSPAMVSPESVKEDADYRTNSGKRWEKTFDVEQIMGNSNHTPKPEYQRKIREFLDSLRAKGVKFDRSENWMAPFDERGADHGYGEDAIGNASELDDWYDDHYKTHHKHYQTGDEDAYGMNAERLQVGVSDWSEVILECAASLLDDYDRNRWKTNDYAGLAQAVYHGWMLDTFRDVLTSEQLEQHKQNLHSEIETVQDTLTEWAHNQFDYADDSRVMSETWEKFEELAPKNGVDLEQLEEQADEQGVEPSELAEELHEDLWQEARDEFFHAEEEAYSGSAWKFLGYLYNLLEHNGAVNPGDLPNPQDRHGGLPSYDDLVGKNEMAQKTPVEQGLPGALSRVDDWHQSPIRN